MNVRTTLMAALALVAASTAGQTASAQAKTDFKIAWSIYVGWMPWGYAEDTGLVDKWAEKYGITIEVTQFNDYVESINQYTAGAFDAVTLTNMDGLSIPAVGGVDTTAVIVGDFSAGNDVLILKDQTDLAAVKGSRVNLVEFSVSHYLLARALDSVGMAAAHRRPTPSATHWPTHWPTRWPTRWATRWATETPTSRKAHPMTRHTPRADIAENRRRYEEHQRKGLRSAPLALPPASPRPAPPLDGPVLHEETIPADWYWGTRLRPGEALRVAQTGAHASVALVCWRADMPSERLNLPDTIKVQWTTTLQKGRVLFSESGRVLLSIIEDSSGAHDVLTGGAATGGSPRNTRDNLILAASKFGLSRRDLPMALSLFAPVAVLESGQIMWQSDRARGDDYVDLRAEMDLLVALSTCPHPLCTTPSAPVQVTRFTAPPPQPRDPCRTASPEAVRAFENTARLLA